MKFSTFYPILQYCNVLTHKTTVIVKFNFYIYHTLLMILSHARSYLHVHFVIFTQLQLT